MKFICVTPRDVFASVRTGLPMNLNPAECAATLLMFDEKILHYDTCRGHGQAVFESVNMLVTLYGQRERLVARSLVKHHISPQQFEDEATRASTLWLSLLSNSTLLAWAITIATSGLLLLTQKEAEAMIGVNAFRIALCTSQGRDSDEVWTTFTQLARPDWSVIPVPLEELALAVVSMLSSPKDSRPCEAFCRYVMMENGHWQDTKLLVQGMPGAAISP